MNKPKNHSDVFLKKFLTLTLDALGDEMHNNSNEYQKIIKTPIFKNNVLSNTKNETICDFAKLIYILKKNITKYSELNSSLIIIQNIYKNKLTKLNQNKYDEGVKKKINKQTQNKYDEDIKKKINNQLFNFVLIYLNNFGFNFQQNNFKKILSNFNEYLIDDSPSHYYLTPLFNVEGDFKKIILSQTIQIRPITNAEYIKITNLENLPIREIPIHHKMVKYVLVNKVEKSFIDNNSMISNSFEYVTNILKLFKDGNPQFGNTYWIPSPNWNVENLKIIEINHERFSYQKYVLQKNDVQQFKNFYNAISKKIENTNHPEFLLSAMRRFGLSYRHQSIDAIVDSVISLESLLVPGIGESTLKLAHRLTSLIGETDSERLKIWTFMKEAYKFRSGIIHESKQRSFKIDSELVEPDNVSKILIMYNKKAIINTCKLLDHYITQKDIVDELDKSMYDRKKLKILIKIIHSKI